MNSKQKAMATHRALLHYLKRHGPHSAEDLAAEFNITAMAVRQHFYLLQDEGYVEWTNQSGARGRPKKLWQLTEAANTIFTDRHKDFAIELLQSIQESQGSEAMAQLIDLRGQKQLKRYSDRLAGLKTLDERVKALADIRTEDGYMAIAELDGQDWLLIENHCPICDAAQMCRQICANELQLFQNALGSEVIVTREDHILAGERRCSYRITRVD